jgi:alginate O-acetyltransferase complex protein AlgI
MLFNSYIFLFVFLPITALGFAVLGRVRPTLTLGWLTLCSFVFYGFWNPVYLWLLGGSIAVNFACAWALGATNNRLGKNLLLAAGVAANLGLIGYFKYAGFFLEIADTVLGTSSPALQLMLPLGISFFTFQQIAYLVDAWKGLVSEHRLVNYSLFVTFFPQLIAGPIVHHNEILPQFTSRRQFRFHADDVAMGIIIFVLGLCKKVVLADNVSGYANDMFNATATGAVPLAHEAWIGVLAFTFQLYFDFSGYSDMAIGLGRLFGIRIPLNFNSPYKAASITEFWRRWHMTLSQFLRDYLYIPLGGSRRGPVRRYFNLLLTMVLGGLWHGAGWTFLLWGFVHGLYLCVHHAWQHIGARAGWQWTARPTWRVAATALTFLAAVVGWVFFRAESLTSATTVLFAMLGSAPSGAGQLIDRPGEAAAILAGMAAIVWLLPSTQQFIQQIEANLDPQRTTPSPLASRWRWLAWQPSFASGVAMAFLFFATLTTMTKISEFLYFNF